MTKLSPIQQHIIDVLKDGGTLRLFWYVREPSVWRLIGADDKGFGIAIKAATIKILENLQLVKIVRDSKTFPPKQWCELVKEKNMTSTIHDNLTAPERVAHLLQEHIHDEVQYAKLGADPDECLYEINNRDFRAIETLLADYDKLVLDSKSKTE